MNKLKKFITYYGPYKGMFYMDMFCALVLSGIDLFFPSLVKYLMDEVYEKRPPNMIEIVFITGAGLLVLYIIRYFCQRYITAQGHIMVLVWKQICAEIFSHICKSCPFPFMTMQIQGH